MLVAGVLLGAKCLWSAAALVPAIQDATQSEHLTLGLLGALFSDGVRVGDPLMDGVDATLLTTTGIFLLWGRHGTGSETRVEQR
ncbi:MAG: hypothetical protein ACHQ9S_00555 [Candidatus Binatia bacterium]